MKFVLDSSAVLALLKPEPAKLDLAPLMAGNAIASVNYSEVADYFARQGHPRQLIAEMLTNLDMDIIVVDAELALDAAMMKPLTRKLGLSLGDRCCLSLAKRLGVPALTGDRKWALIADAVDVEIQLIR